METKEIRLKIKVRDLQNILPQILIETLGIKDYTHGLLDETQLETPGDIKDLINLLSHKINWTTEPSQLHGKGPDPLIKFIEFYKFTQASYGILSQEEWKQLPITKEFFKIYPNLTETAAIHAWG